ncbi:MAG: phosphotransferase [Acidiferrobacterales bacterium]
MSVAVLAGDRALQLFLDEYATGAVHSCACIETLADERNFRICAEQGDFVLTVFGAAAASDIAPIPDMADFLARRRVPCPTALRNVSGGRIGALRGVPAVLSQLMRGDRQAAPEAVHCDATGTMLAQLHIAGQGFFQQLPENRGAQAWRDAAQRVATLLDRHDEQMLTRELEFHARYRLIDLPRGIIHANPVRAGILLEGGQVSGLAGVPQLRVDTLLYDLAVAVNDWCSYADGGMDALLARALLGAYHVLRPLSALERGAWPVLLRAAALHSWMSALYDAHFPRHGWGPSGVDPDTSKRVLLDRIETESAARSVWPDGRTPSSARIGPRP